MAGQQTSAGGSRWRALSSRGYFGSRAAAHRGLFLWSAVLALLATFISYPGIWYSDSYVRVTTGGAVLNAVIKTLTGHRFPLNTDNAFTVIPSFFMAFSQGLTGHVGLYTFAQAFAFFAAAFLLIRELNPVCPRIQMVLFGLSPLIYGMAVYYEAGVGCAAGLVCLMLLFLRAGAEKSRGDRALELFLVFFASFVAFGYRTNALTVLPVLVFQLFRTPRGSVRRWPMLLALMGGIVFTAVPSRVFDIHSYSTASSGLVWEMLSVIQRLPEEKQPEYQNYLDEIGGEGSTRLALETSTEDTAGNFMWGDALGIRKMSAPGATVTAARKYAELFFREPGAFLRLKGDFIKKTMGISMELDYSEYDYNRWDRMAEYGFNDSPQRHAFHDSFIRLCDLLGFYVLRPWVSFLLSLLTVVVLRIRKHPLRETYSFTFWMAVFYYLAYLLDTPAFDFRYFYPSLFLMMIMHAAVSLMGLNALLGRLKKRLRIPEHRREPG
ncbi:MAG: hypothetical protein IKE24_09250 [Clostridia bacterium]|nr:hypothetical protein [Clostridia bacterium]